MKRLFAVVLALLLVVGIALAETSYDVNTYVAEAGYKPETAKNKSGAMICDYFEPAKGAHTLVWSDAKTVYTVTASRNRDKLKALYADLVSLYTWDSCAYTIDEAVQFAYNVADTNAAKTYKTQTNYAKAVVKYVYPDGTGTPSTGSPASSKTQNYVLNTNSKKFHLPDCTDVDKMKKENRQNVRANRDDLIAQGYEPCQHCNP